MLETYRRKRDFRSTSEPEASQAAAGRGGLRFVVQKHMARRLHYDFRLEWDGALKSWAVPKGPSLDPTVKRLAVMVEDHPLAYAAFEGVIADGNYGAGQVIVWDTGVYSPDEGGRLSFDDRDEAEARMRAGLASGKLSFTLRGRKLQGSWTLVKTARADSQWLLIKHRDQHATAGDSVLDQDSSVVSHLTVQDMKAGRLPEPWRVSGGERSAIGTPAPLPAAFSPMLAGSADRPFSHPDWIFEPKLDGFRCVAVLQKDGVLLSSRTGHRLNEYFPEVVDELRAQPESEMLLDGEIVALNQEGVPDFQLLQNSTNLEFFAGGRRRKARKSESGVIAYYVFDLLYLDGRSLLNVPLEQRKALLSRAVLFGQSVKPVEHVSGDGEAFFQAAQRLGIEGMVAKRRDGIYQPGTRSKAWLKVKGVREQDFVIGGFTRGAGERAVAFGALLLGYRQDGQLHYCGKVGAGFDQRALRQLRPSLERMGCSESPFAGAVEDVKEVDVTWVRPQMVARVRYASWTDDRRLRAPVFLAIRPDANPEEVGLESPEPVQSLPPLEWPSAGHEEDLESVLEQLRNTKDRLILEMDGHRLSLTNLNKPLWPAQGDANAFTKRDMVRYYAQVGRWLLPHLRNRPMTLTRYPDGIHKQSFYQKHWEGRLPDYVETVRLFSSTNEGDVDYVMVNNLPTLLWLAQAANIEFHPWLSRVAPGLDAPNLADSFTGSKEAIEQSALNYPDFIVFDLDPYIFSGNEKAGEEPELNRRAFSKTTQVAFALKSILDELSLSSYVKTSGKTGLHVYVPVVRQYDFTVTRKTCEVIGRHLMELRPGDVTMEWTVSKRTGKIFLDHNQNVRGKNMASIYSLRPLAGAPVSTPVAWDELDHIYPPQFNLETAPERLRQEGDLWAGILDTKHDISRLFS